MTSAQRDLLFKAQEILDAARLLHREGFHVFAASRAYYAMFSVAQAFLEGDGLAFSRHTVVIAAFGQHFARPGRVAVVLHRSLFEAMARRQEGEDVCPLLAQSGILAAQRGQITTRRPVGVPQPCLVVRIKFYHGLAWQTAALEGAWFYSSGAYG